MLLLITIYILKGEIILKKNNLKRVIFIILFVTYCKRIFISNSVCSTDLKSLFENWIKFLMSAVISTGLDLCDMADINEMNNIVILGKITNYLEI